MSSQHYEDKNVRFELPKTLEGDKARLESADVPIVTVSASFRTEIAEAFGEQSEEEGQDVVFSRAHFSMALAILNEAQERGLKSWLIDPINYVPQRDWQRLEQIEETGKLIARNPLLKKLKDLFNSLIRSKVSISEIIRPVLLHITENVSKPIISLHYEAGNILAKNGKKVLQVVTDPHVHPSYLRQAQRENIFFAVFDENTKRQLLEKAKEQKKKLNADRVFVTGPPVDRRIVEARKSKKPNSYTKRPLRLVITTGGLGTNKGEIGKVLEKLMLKIKEGKVQIILNAGTHMDFYKEGKNIARKHKIKIGKLADEKAQFRIIYEGSIVDANTSLIKYAFPWADGFVTKPSGDMAYDAAAAGCFILSLTPWGEWEEKVKKIFKDKKVLKVASVNNFSQQIDKLIVSGWIEQAIQNALKIDNIFLRGTKNIVDLEKALT